ncbi:MAG: hypothetical protein FWH18_05355 [Marinilabiliaceae bacterium]|nr:hypothetical protein [Marinilabiliaceae bacterium]
MPSPFFSAILVVFQATARVAPTKVYPYHSWQPQGLPLQIPLISLAVSATLAVARI